MQKTEYSTVKGKFWSEDRAPLMVTAVHLRDVLGDLCLVSAPLPSREGGWHIMLTLYVEEERPVSSGKPETHQ